MEWSQFFDDISDFFTNTANWWAVIWFFVTLIFGVIFVKLVARLSRKIFERAKMEAMMEGLLLAIIKVFLYLVLAIILLSIVGVEVNGIITTIAAAVLAVGLAIEDILTNIADALIIVSTKMFKKGDTVEVDGITGSVVDINFIFTSIMTFDGKCVTIPNTTFIKNSVKNITMTPTRRIELTFSVAYESDVELVKKIILDVVKSDGRVLLEPKEPTCRLKTLNSSSIDFFMCCWVDNSDYLDTSYYITETVYNEFKRHSISVPFQQIEVRQRTDNVVMPVIENAVKERVEKVRDEEKKKFDIETDSLREYIKEKIHKKETYDEN